MRVSEQLEIGRLRVLFFLPASWRGRLSLLFLRLGRREPVNLDTPTATAKVEQCFSAAECGLQFLFVRPGAPTEIVFDDPAA